MIPPPTDEMAKQKNDARTLTAQFVLQTAMDDAEIETDKVLADMFETTSVTEKLHKNPELISLRTEMIMATMAETVGGTAKTLLESEDDQEVALGRVLYQASQQLQHH